MQKSAREQNYVSFAGTQHESHANITTRLHVVPCMGAGTIVHNLVTALSTHIPMSTADCSACQGAEFCELGGFKIATSPVLSCGCHATVRF